MRSEHGFETVKGQKRCRIAFAADGRDLDSPISHSLASAPYFIVMEGSPDNYTVVDNTGRGLGSEGGHEAARELVGLEVDIVVTGNIGAKTSTTLDAAGVKVFAGCSGTVREAVGKCLADKLVAVKGATYSGCLETVGTSKVQQ